MRTHNTMIALVAVAMLLGTGCYSTVMENPNVAPGEVKEQWNNHFIFGLAGTSEINVNEMCPNGVKRIENVRTFGNGCLGLVTIGIYTPHTSRITCAGGSAYLIGVDDEGNAVQMIDVSGTELASVPLTTEGEGR